MAVENASRNSGRSAACAILAASALRMAIPVGVEKRHGRAGRGPSLGGGGARLAQRFINDRANRGKATSATRTAAKTAIDRTGRAWGVFAGEGSPYALIRNRIA